MCHGFVSSHGLVLISEFYYYGHVVTNIIYYNVRNIVAMGSGTVNDVIYQTGCLMGYSSRF